MKLKLSEIFGIKAAFERLTNYQQVVNGQTAIVPFSFSGKTRWNIAKNSRICSDAVKPWEDVLKSLKEEYKIEPETKLSDQNYQNFEKAAQKAAEEIIEEYNFVKIPLSELIDDKNPVSADVLGVLDRYELLIEEP